MTKAEMSEAVLRAGATAYLDCVEYSLLNVVTVTARGKMSESEMRFTARQYRSDTPYPRTVRMIVADRLARIQGGLG